MKLLLVEDEIRIREGMKKILEKSDKGYTVAGEAGDGAEGLEMIRTLEPDLVITDIMMPNMDGLEMLRRAREEKMNPEVIVLSAYSEFEYARGAMKLGVTEYLLKPIGFAEFLQALSNVEDKLIARRKAKPEKVGSSKQVFRDFLEGNMSLDSEISDYLLHTYNITEETPFMLFLAYMGDDYDTLCEKVQKELKNVFSLNDILVEMVPLPERSMLSVIAYNYRSDDEVRHLLQHQILRGNARKVVYGCASCATINKLSEALRELLPYMDWEIALGENVLISYPNIKKVQTYPCIYPLELETKCKVAVCTNEWDKVEKCAGDFMKYYRDGKVYEPKEVKENYVRFIWALIGIAKEVGAVSADQLQQQLLLEKITRAKRAEDLSEVMNTVLGAMKTEEAEAVTNLTVKRTLNMIHEFYQTGITLDQISDKLKVTPEYIGTQFHKEVGVTFSNYIRNLRVTKAKELLCSTDLKLYQVSEQVGYTDPKYFSKVFKEVTGQLPAEYRKTYK